MVLQVYHEIEKMGGRNGFIEVDTVRQALDIDGDLTLEYIRSLQILEYVQYDENANRVRLVK